MPSSFDSSSGVRWFAIVVAPLVGQQKDPPRSQRRRAQPTVLLVVCGRNQGTRLPERSIRSKNNRPVGDGRKRSSELVRASRSAIAEVRGDAAALPRRRARASRSCSSTGLGGAATNWLALAPLLARDQACSCPSCPGHGGSAPLPAAPIAERLRRPVSGSCWSRKACLGRRSSATRSAARSRCGSRSAGRTRSSALVLAGAAGISSATRRARYALTITGIVKPGRRIAPHRRRIARSNTLKRRRLRPLGRVGPAGACRRSSSRRFSPGPRATPTPSAPRRRSSATTRAPTSTACVARASCSGAHATTSCRSTTRSTTPAASARRCG